MPTTTPAPTFERELEDHRRALTGYCYRMLGSGFEAEDAVQETFVRAWRRADDLQAAEALRSWLYRIATNVCLDMRKGPQRRARPMDLGPSSAADERLLGAPLPESAWVLPIPDSRVLPDGGDPATMAAERETLRLAFVAALQHLPARQRAVLVLREVLHWQASEVAELLESSVASVNSALQRARATLADAGLDVDAAPATVDDADQQALVDRYLAAFERYDIDEIVSLLRDDIEFSMPPYTLWLRGPELVAQWLGGPGKGCRGSRVIPVRANGGFAYAQYRPAPDGGHEPWGLATLEVTGGRVTAITTFLGSELFPAFGVPLRLEPEG